MSAPDRLAGLRRFAVAITVLNVLGHTVLGFEQSILQPLAALAAAYGTEIALDWIDARARGTAPRFAGGFRARKDFLLSAHISAMAAAMLLYANDQLGPVMFAASAAIASKAVFRTGAADRHFFNPSNLGITATLLLFPWVGIAPPYMFTENLHGWADWILPVVIVCTGSFLNTKFTGRMPLIGTWMACFIAQAGVRSVVTGQPLASALLPMTGVAFLLFSFYMVTDPATTPSGVRGQVAFGAGVAAVYGALTAAHVVFGLFFALSIVCAVRGVAMWAADRVPKKVTVPHAVSLPRPAPIPAGAAMARVERAP
jgi:hypothetical protein